MATTPSSFELAVSAAAARSSGQRAWKLVELAAALRRERRFDQALGILDLAVEQTTAPRVELAAYTCAVAIHCDRRDYETARLLAEETRAKAADAHQMRALGRMYSGLFQETGDEVFAREADRCLTFAALWEELGARLPG